MQLHTRACLPATCFDPGIFARLVDGDEPQLVEKSYNNKETIIFPESKLRGGGGGVGGVQKLSGGPSFSKVNGPNCFFL